MDHQPQGSRAVLGRRPGVVQLERFSVFLLPRTLFMLADVAAGGLRLPSDDASFAVARLLAYLAEGLSIEATTAGASLASRLSL